MINAWRKEQAVFAIESFVVRRIPPRLAVTGDERGQIGDPGDPALTFNVRDPLLEKTLNP